MAYYHCICSESLNPLCLMTHWHLGCNIYSSGLLAFPFWHCFLCNFYWVSQCKNAITTEYHSAMMQLQLSTTVQWFNYYWRSQCNDAITTEYHSAMMQLLLSITVQWCNYYWRSQCNDAISTEYHNAMMHLLLSITMQCCSLCIISVQVFIDMYVKLLIRWLA
jgi:hypothetical protein